MTRPAAPARLEFLDAVRGVAALVVATSHGAELLFDGFDRWQYDWGPPGRAGVCAFFLVSGFVIPISLERGGGLAEFAVGRACRLYPAYWVSLAAMLVVTTIRPVLSTDFEAELPWSAVINATMVQELVGVPHAIGLYYTLTIELIWYALVAALFALGVLHRTEALAWLGLAGLAVVGLGVPLLADRHVPFSTGFYLATMLVGTACARHVAGTLPGPRLAALVGAAAAVAVAGSWANYERVPGPSVVDGAFGVTPAVLPWVVAYAGFLVAIRWRERHFPAVLVWLGLVSYSVYLLHPVLLPLLAESRSHPWVRLAVLLVGTVAMAAVVQRFVEAPGQELGRRWRARLRTRREAAPTTAATVPGP